MAVPPADQSPLPRPAPPEADPGPDRGPAYRSLYRRYRPQLFSQVRGQDHVTRALRNAVRDGKVAHAYLFSGPRGTGKTSTARILAMALNCAHPVDGEPEGTCDSCVEIRRGSSVDVHELDAASNRKLDEMRDLLSRVALGTRGRHKVYIVDEVHQLTPDAASALLKTLEEPPAHVVFVLATTDPQRVLPTIRSRTQHFEFRLLPSEVLGSLLSDVNADAHLGLTPQDLDRVVRRGHGSARDALSALDQVAAAGGVDDEGDALDQVAEALADRDPGRVLVAVAEATAAGRDPRRLAVELLGHLRDGFLVLQAPSLVQLGPDAVAAVRAQAERLGLATVVRAMELLGQASTDMRDAVDPRITLEAALIRLAAPDADDTRAALLERIERLERIVGEKAEGLAAPNPTPRVAPRLETGPGAPPASGPGAPPPLPPRRGAPRPAAGPPASVSPVVPPPPPVSVSPAVPPPPPALVPPPPPPPASVPAEPAARPALGAHRSGTPRPVAPAPSDADLPSRDALTTAWGDVVLPGLRPGVKAYLSSGRFVSVESGAAVFALPDTGLLQRADPVRIEAEAALAAHFGRPVPLRLVLDERAAPADQAERRSEPEDDPANYDLTDLRDAGAAVVSPEQRLLQAFPGAEEVTP